MQEASKASQSQDWNIDAVEVILLEITLKRWVDRRRHGKSQCFLYFVCRNTKEVAFRNTSHFDLRVVLLGLKPAESWP